MLLTVNKKILFTFICVELQALLVNGPPSYVHNGDLAKFVSLQKMCKKVLIDEANISKTILMTLLFNFKKTAEVECM